VLRKIRRVPKLDGGATSFDREKWHQRWSKTGKRSWKFTRPKWPKHRNPREIIEKATIFCVVLRCFNYLTRSSVSCSTVSWESWDDNPNWSAFFGGMFGLGCISLLSLFSFAHYDYYCNLLQLLLLLPLSIILRDIAVTIIIIASYFYFYWQYNENIWHTVWLFNIAMERSTIFNR